MSCLTNVEPTMSIRKVPQQNIYTCAFDTMCIWCDKIINRGGQINIFAFKEFTGSLRDLLTRITVCNKIPIGVSILNQLGNLAYTLTLLLDSNLSAIFCSIFESSTT